MRAILICAAVVFVLAVCAQAANLEIVRFQRCSSAACDDACKKVCQVAREKGFRAEYVLTLVDARTKDLVCEKAITEKQKDSLCNHFSEYRLDALIGYQFLGCSNCDQNEADYQTVKAIFKAE